MDEAVTAYDPERAAALRALLRTIVEALLQSQLRPA
jgi:hypothetical protein